MPAIKPYFDFQPQTKIPHVIIIVSLQNLFEFHLNVWLYLLQNLSTRLSILSSSLPYCWKAAIVTPLFKSSTLDFPIFIQHQFCQFSQSF